MPVPRSTPPTSFHIAAVYEPPTTANAQLQICLRRSVPALSPAVHGHSDACYTSTASHLLPNEKLKLRSFSHREHQAVAVCLLGVSINRLVQAVPKAHAFAEHLAI